MFFPIVRDSYVSQYTENLSLFTTGFKSNMEIGKNRQTYMRTTVPIQSSPNWIATLPESDNTSSLV